MVEQGPIKISSNGAHRPRLRGDGCCDGRTYEPHPRAQALVPTLWVMTSPLTPTCLWRTTPPLIEALADTFGDPDDGYVNGSQVWLRETDTAITLEWRLHPVANFASALAASGLDASAGAHHELFATVAAALSQLSTSPAKVDPSVLWDGLECFPAYGDELEPATLALAVRAMFSVAPDACGLVDHDSIGDAWERAATAVSIVDLLFDQLNAHKPAPDTTAPTDA